MSHKIKVVKQITFFLLRVRKCEDQLWQVARRVWKGRGRTVSGKMVQCLDSVLPNRGFKSASAHLLRWEGPCVQNTSPWQQYPFPSIFLFFLFLSLEAKSLSRNCHLEFLLSTWQREKSLCCCSMYTSDGPSVFFSYCRPVAAQHIYWHSLLLSY